MVRVVARLDTLRPAPGAQGQLKKIPQEAGFSVYMREDYGSYSPFPTSKFPLTSLREILLTWIYYSLQSPLQRRCAGA